jgi:hypothetical protein
LAKALAVAFDVTALAFEAPDVRGAVVGENVANYSRNNGVILNVGTAGRLFAADNGEDEHSVNFDLAGKQNWLRQDGPFDTFCRVAAGCVSDDQFDSLCKAAIGEVKYRQFFADWGRDRAE